MKCPNCGKSHYREVYSTSTCLGWHPEFKDGVQINKDPNTLTTHYECCECGAKFHTSNFSDPILDKPGKSYSVEIEGQKVLDVTPMSIPKDLVGSSETVVIDSNGVIHGMENVGTITNMNRYRTCQICGKDFICGSCISTGIGPNKDKYICDECAKSLKVLVDLIPIIQENRDEIQALKDKLRDKTKKNIDFKE